MRVVEEYVRATQLPEQSPRRATVLRTSATPARTAGGGLAGVRPEAQTPFQPVALVTGIRKERYLNGSGRVAIDPSQVSYVSYVADAGNVAVVDLAIAPELRPQNRFFRYTLDLARPGSSATVLASGASDPKDEEFAVWEAAALGGTDRNGIIRTEYAFDLTFCLGSSIDDNGARVFVNPSFGARSLQTSLFSGGNGNFQLRTRDNRTVTYDLSPDLISFLFPNTVVAQAYASALREAGVIGPAELSHVLSVGVKYTVTQKWLGPSGFVRDFATLAWIPVSDGVMLNRAVSDGVVDSPVSGGSGAYRGF